MRLSDEQLNRMARAVLARANRAFEDAPLATDWRQKYVDLRGVCHEQEATITRGIVYRRTLYGLLVAAVVVGAVGWWR